MTDTILFDIDGTGGGFGADELLSAGAARVLDSPAEVKL
jgi:phosphoglycolate phosphatase-like HAD superfamily hydrolase